MLNELDRARKLVVAAEAYLEDQRQMVASLAAYEQDTAHAERLLHLMEEVLQALREHVSLVERSLRAVPLSRAHETGERNRG